MPVKGPKSDDDDDDKKVTTSKPSFKPSKKPTKKPTDKPVKSTDEPTFKPTDKPASSGVGKVVIVEQEVLGITKRSSSWKTNMEEALLPVIAKALDIKHSALTYTVITQTPIQP